MQCRKGAESSFIYSFHYLHVYQLTFSHIVFFVTVLKAASPLQSSGESNLRGEGSGSCA